MSKLQLADNELTLVLVMCIDAMMVLLFCIVISSIERDIMHGRKRGSSPLDIRKDRMNLIGT